MSKTKSPDNVGDELKKGNTPLFMILFCVMVLFVVGFFMLYNYKQVDAESELKRMYVEDASELRVLSQAIAVSAVAAANGSGEAFDELNRDYEKFSGHWRNIVDGNDSRGMSKESHYAKSTAKLQVEIAAIWNQDVEDNVTDILGQKELVGNLDSTITEVSKAFTSIQTLYDSLVEVMLRSRVASDQIIYAQRQALLSEQLKGRMQRLSSGVDDVKFESTQFSRDVSTFMKVLSASRQGDARLGVSKITDQKARVILDKITQVYNSASGSLMKLDEVGKKGTLTDIRKAARVIDSSSEKLLLKITELNAEFKALKSDSPFSNQMGILLGAFGVFIIVIIFYLVWRSSKADSTQEGILAQQREQLLAAQNEESQAAILRLLDEISTLGDGDLTVDATVSEDFTGAIADAINYAIEQLRTLVATINETAVQVAASAQETQATAMHLAEASEHQAQEIAGASAAVNEMAVSIDQVSSNAGESTSVAEKAVDIAKKGSQVVHNTIEGMETIREQIQETSKRIKRLGESSQEIGDIISLITDIADQTNILALNAAIQASMAGDAGRGFAVVADEVQRLAERTSNATKQIEALVKTIQSDTNEAVISMENTTSEVVRGARLAQDAGVALEEIEQVSKALADLIFNISNAARQQAASAGHISNTMNVIQEITSQTSSGTTATARSIGNLAELADQMRKSVAGFKLPR